MAIILITSGVIASLVNVALAISFLCIALVGIMLYGAVFITPPPFPWNRGNGWIFVVGLTLLAVIFANIAR